ncbi:hypothetical protein AA0114_g12202 [Alternaria tenuissima]|uniref:Uncharacterized protein n=1 Tax=Alternaria tenuissima TaxID=119927 RepID=A0A4V1WL35_9PLEO|nr:hypothetical protein AA0114_g12202 [Alternaria tenuissima]
MDIASDKTPPDPRLTMGDLQQPPLDPFRVHDQMQTPEIEARQSDQLTPELEDSADQECDANGNGMLRDKFPGSATTPEEDPGSEAESSVDQNEQLVVKLKYNTKTKTTNTSSSSDHQRSANGISVSLKRGATSGTNSSPSSGSPIVKQESGHDQYTVSPNSKTTDPQIKIEKDGEQALVPSPISKPIEESSQAEVIKDELDHDARQQIDQSHRGLAQDEMNVDVHPGNGTMYVPANDNTFNKSLDITDTRVAVPAPRKLQESVAVNKRGADDVDCDYQQSEIAPPEAARGENNVLNDDDYLSDVIDSQEWSPNAINKQHKGRPAIDHQLVPSGFTSDEMNVQQQDQVKQIPHIFSTGQPDLGVQDVWIQPHPDFPDPAHLTTTSSSPRHQDSRVSNPKITLEGLSQFQTTQPHHVSQRPSDQCNQPNFDPSFSRQQQLQAQIERQKKQLEDFRKQNEEWSQQSQQSLYGFGYTQRQSNAPPSFITGPLTYQRAPHFSNQQVSNGLNSPGFQRSAPPTVSYSQMPLNMSYCLNPASLYKSTTKISAPPSLNTRVLGPYAPQGPQETSKKTSDVNDCSDERDASDDDEPLQSRVKRHPSVTSSRDSVIGMSPLITASDGITRHRRQDNDSDVELVTSKSKPNHATREVKQNQVRNPQPASAPSDNAPPSSENAEEIDWTLPQYEVQRQLLAKGEEIPSAKVSLPGLVREEILLSPDHADEEVHLLMNIFIPNQRALPNQDPEPAIALLNFHTIAVMVIEAYVQYEIGDEFGTGRGHFHTEHNRGDAEYERMRDAVDADTNDIFFAVVDRYRAGLESKKKPLQLIRGTQEFCDLALDLIFYIKDHGLLRPEPKSKAARADKGVKRGPRGGAKADEAKGKGIKRGTTAKPNEVQPRKKAKTAPVLEVKKKRSKPKTSGITVLRR